MSFREVSMQDTAIVWFRNDLRLHDHEPLTRALTDFARVLPVYCFDPRHFRDTHWGFPKTGSFRARFLIEAVNDLRIRLKEVGGELAIRVGEPEKVLPLLAKEVNAKMVLYHREIADEERRVEEMVLQGLNREGITTQDFWGDFLFHPEDIPFSANNVPDIFSDFRRGCEKKSRVRSPLPAPSKMRSPKSRSDDLPDLDSFDLCETNADSRAILQFKGGERPGLQRLYSYFWEKDLLKRYKQTRNGLLGDYSSKFSVWLSHGCLSPREIHAQVLRYERQRVKNQSTYWLVFELIWRDFFRYAFLKHGNRYFHAGGIKDRVPYARWRSSRFLAWTRGETGVPFVDANMIELRRTGFMSNRGRQNVASFLVHNLQLPWRAGAAWFEHLLLDYDVYSNWGNWAYVAGVGNDPRPGRKFNILRQADKYDAKGHFVRTWLPQLDHLPNEHIHSPHAMSDPPLPEDDIYRDPLVDLHKE